MIKIYICENEKAHQAIINKYIRDYILFQSYNMEVACVTNRPNVVIEKIKKEKSIGAYFLDIGLNSNMNGIQLAEQIRNEDPRGFIVFVTSHVELSFLTFQYKVEALDIIAKDSQMVHKIHACIDNIYIKYTSANNNIHKTFAIKLNNEYLYLNTNEIIYFETSPNVHKTYVHTDTYKLEFTGLLKNIEPQLDDNFFRCHRSSIVNKNFISSIDYKNKVIHLINGDSCLISGKKAKEMKALTINSPRLQ